MGQRGVVFHESVKQPSDMEEPVRGYLVLSVLEATGRNKEEQNTWVDVEEAFVKVELRGGSRNIKAATDRQSVRGGNLVSWKQQLTLDVLENSNELRIMLCKDKVVQGPSGTKRGTTVIAACGIYVKDIIDAVPIDKYFELFKPSAGGEGGFIRLGLNFVKDKDQIPKQPAEPAANGRGTASSGAGAPASKGKRRGAKAALVTLLSLAALGALGAGGYFGYKKFDEERKKKQGK